MGKTTAQNGAYVLKDGMISMLLLLGIPPKLIFFPARGDEHPSKHTRLQLAVHDLESTVV